MCRETETCLFSGNQYLLNLEFLCLFGFYNFLISSCTVNVSGLESHADTGVCRVDDSWFSVEERTRGYCLNQVRRDGS